MNEQEDKALNFSKQNLGYFSSEDSSHQKITGNNEKLFSQDKVDYPSISSSLVTGVSLWVFINCFPSLLQFLI